MGKRGEGGNSGLEPRQRREFKDFQKGGATSLTKGV